MFIFELVVSSITSALFLFFLVTALKLKGSGNAWVGPGVFPAILSSIVLICSVIWLVDTIMAIRKRKSNAVEPAGEEAHHGILHLSKESKRLALIIILTVLYIMVLMPLIGFAISTCLFLFVSVMLFHGKWIPALIVSVVMSAAMFVLFKYMLHLPMPR